MSLPARRAAKVRKLLAAGHAVKWVARKLNLGRLTVLALAPREVKMREGKGVRCKSSSTGSGKATGR